MIRNYIIIALRNIAKNKVFSFINIAGLSAGIACFILLFLFIKDELSYDRFHVKGEDIYRVTAHATISGNKFDLPIVPSPLGKALVDNLPEVLDFTRIKPEGRILIKMGDSKFYQKDVIAADTSFFKLFTYKFIEGNPKTCLKEPYSIVLAESIAKKCFGKTKSALNNYIRIDNERDYKITGVIKDPPSNSHIKFSVVISYQTLIKDKITEPDKWDSFSDYTYVLVKKGTKASVLNPKIEELFKKNAVDFIKNSGIHSYFNSQALYDIHLYSKLNFEMQPNGDINYIYICISVAFLILIIACINYMNLATARSANRAKEIGIRKVMGSYRSHLIQQFIAESFITTFFALLLSILLIQLAMPSFNIITNKDLNINLLSQPYLFLILIGVFLFVGFLGGSYPAFFLSSFQPISILKGKLSAGTKGLWLRKCLVVFQFSVSIVLIIGTFIIYEQLKYVNTKNLGFTKDQILVVELNDSLLVKNIKSLKATLNRNPSFQKISTAESAPGSDYQNHNGFNVKIRGESKKFILLTYGVDENYFDLLDIKLKEGRNFDKNMSTDGEHAAIINERAAKDFGLKNVLGVQIGSNGDSTFELKVIGIIKDFHFHSLHEPIRPMLLTYKKNEGRHLLIKVPSTNIENSIKHIEKVYNSFSPPSPFEYHFLDQNFKEQYEHDEKKGLVFLAFSILTIFIALLGLFGLSLFTTEQRSKEIGIRKVLGASIYNVIMIISKEFIILVAVASIIAWPLAYYFIREWLSDFEYKTPISPITFIVATLLTFFIAFLTLLYQAIKASIVNPINSLKAE